MLLRNWWKRKRKVCQFFSFNGALTNPAIANICKEFLLPLMVEPANQKRRKQPIRMGPEPGEMVAVDD